MAEATPSAAAPPAQEHEHEQIAIEAEPEPESARPSDADSAFGDDIESYTTSLKSSVLNYRYENGRRYHGFKDETGYILPNDDEENDRLDLYHHLQTLRIDGELHTAPLNNPQRILDIATGTGIWAIDMGDKYPSAEILGNDISPIQPSLVPPNVKFEVDDVEDEWVYSSKFDYIHCRYMTCSIRDWPKLMRQAYKYTKPGGWAEFQDFDDRFYTTSGDFTVESIIGQWSKTVREGVKQMGLEPNPGPQLEGWMKDAGFINVHARCLPLPVGTWPKDKKLKEIGAFNLIMYLDNLEGINLRLFSNTFGWSTEEIKVYCAELRTAFKNQKLRIQHNYFVVYGQKAENVVD